MNSNKKDQLIQNALSFDSLSEAEKLTGRSYKNDDTVTWLGIGLTQQNSADRQRLLEETDDTTFSNDLERYLRIVTDEGFELLLRDEFECVLDPQQPRQEAFYVLFSRAEGLLMEFNTFGDNHVNGGKFYYNWKPAWDINDRSVLWPQGLLSSGGYQKLPDGSYIWAGDHDCREAVRFHLRRLRQHGTFVTPWVKRPYFSLLNYTERRQSPKQWPASGEYAKSITEARLLRLPEDVQAAL